MTVKQLLAQSLNLTRYPDLSGMPIEAQAEVMSALNAAIQTYHQNAPDIFKRTTGYHDMAGPSTLTGLSIAANSTTNTGTPFLAADKGKTLYCGGSYNEIASPTELLRPNTSGATITSGTLYDDTLTFFDSSVERLVGHPRCIFGTESWTLARVDGDHARRLFAHQYASGFSRIMGLYSVQDRAVSDRPRYYGVHAVGQSVATSNDAAFMLRVDPLFTRGVVLEITIDQLPAAMTPAAIWDDTVLPVPDQRIHSLLLPIFRANLVGTSIWTGNQVQTQFALAERDQARAELMRLPTSFAPTVSRIGTTMGY